MSTTNNQIPPGKKEAVLTPSGGWQGDGVGGILDEPNSPVAYTSVNIRDWLQKRCKRIPEKLAREIHPALFCRLDAVYTETSDVVSSD